MWFAFKLVSLSHWIQHYQVTEHDFGVVICFQISIFEPLNTALVWYMSKQIKLWFAFKLVSLSHWIQRTFYITIWFFVVICFQISIFEPLNTASLSFLWWWASLWFAFKLVSLSHWIQPNINSRSISRVVICFQISIFEPLNTAAWRAETEVEPLWFAFKLVSLSHWIQRDWLETVYTAGCDLLSN